METSKRSEWPCLQVKLHISHCCLQRVSESSYLRLLLDDVALGYSGNSENRQRNDDDGGTGVNEDPSDMNIIDKCFQIQ